MVVKRTTQQAIEPGNDCPIDLAVIPNYMGINLCSVEGVSWERQEDGQLKWMTFHFTPAPPEDEHESTPEPAAHASSD